MRLFPGATSLLKGATFIDFWSLKNFLRIFNFLFLWLCIKESNYLLFKRGLRLFKGLCLLFLPNVPGAMFIQGGTFIPDSRVITSTVSPHSNPWSTFFQSIFWRTIYLVKFLKNSVPIYGYYSKLFCNSQQVIMPKVG